MRVPLSRYSALRRSTLAVALFVLYGAAKGRPSPSTDSTTTTSATGPSQLLQRAQQRQQLLEKNIKDSFMNSLEALKEKARVVKNSTYSVEEKREHIRKYKKHLEDKQTLDKLYDVDEGVAAETFIFRHAGAGHEESGTRWTRGQASRIYFTLDIPHPSDPKKETVVTSAVLHLYNLNPSLQREDQTDHRFTTAKLYQLLSPRSNSSRPVRKWLHTRLIPAKKSPGWDAFDLTDVVKHWREHPNENYGLEVITEMTSDNQRIYFNDKNIRGNSVTAADTITKELLPSLKVSTAQRHILGRVKRAPERYNCRVGDGEKRCCRYPLWVSFSDIGWDEWVISPDGYQAYYCDGACPDRYKPASNFAGIKSILHMINPRSVPGPCCTASKTDSLDLLHYDEVGNLVVTEYKGMVVQNCKCS